MTIHILIIDDDPTIRHLATFILKEKREYQIQAAANLQQAKDLVEQQQPDVVLCDLMLPGATGIDFLKWGQQRAEMVGVPVIIISASGEGRLLSEAQKSGAFDCLSKPFSKVQLLEMVERALESISH